MDNVRAALDEGADYAAEHVIVLANRKTVTRDAHVLIVDGELAVLHNGPGPIEERMIVAAPVGEVEVLGRPWYGLGQSVDVRIGEHRWQLQPESASRGSGLATPKKMRRARDSVAAFEAALAAA